MLLNFNAYSDGGTYGFKYQSPTVKVKSNFRECPETCRIFTADTRVKDKFKHLCGGFDMICAVPCVDN